MRRNTRLRAAALVLAGAALTMGVTACQTGSDNQLGGDGDLDVFVIEGNWQLADGSSGPSGAIDPLEGNPVTLAVDDMGAVSGNDGCNSYAGTVEVQGDEVTFSPFTGTLMACEEDVMAVADAYQAAVAGVTHGSVQDGQLVLTGDDVELLFDPRS